MSYINDFALTSQGILTLFHFINFLFKRSLKRQCQALTHITTEIKLLIVLVVDPRYSAENLKENIWFVPVKTDDNKEKRREIVTKGSHNHQNFTTQIVCLPLQPK